MGLQSGLGGAAVLEEVGLQSGRGWGCSPGGGRAAIWEGVGLQSGRRGEEGGGKGRGEGSQSVRLLVVHTLWSF